MTTSRCEPQGRMRISIVAAVVLNSSGKTLLVRKRGTEAFMQPGGKLAAGETNLAALERELGEELGCGVERESCRALGRFSAPAAHEPGFTVEAELFAVTLAGQVRPSAEIEEAVWIDPDVDPSVPLAPLTRRHAIPLARRLKLGRSGAVSQERVKG